MTFNRNSQYQKAIGWLEKSLDLAKEISDYEGQAVSLSHLGFSYLGLNDYAKAEELCSEGLKLALSVNRKSTIGRCYQVLAESEAMRKHKRKASKHAQSALEMFERLGMTHESDEVKRHLK
ncbi:MAG: tetratricopeptide repeat protein [Ruminococcus sp.]|nr:tetratricopeptide repeat protein [Ruminococcus sp.]